VPQPGGREIETAHGRQHADAEGRETDLKDDAGCGEVVTGEIVESVIETIGRAARNANGTVHGTVVITPTRSRTRCARCSTRPPAGSAII